MCLLLGPVVDQIMAHRDAKVLIPEYMQVLPYVADGSTDGTEDFRRERSLWIVQGYSHRSLSESGKRVWDKRRHEVESGS